ncbi:Gfo/Idh/MocA family protein [Pseudooceanicola sp. HF7]|uniref:Gfo/Idh/MocA family protein n=1 Tax=Pseudooceanicola sp. HF7 TaxID=2721560 RepID=UPI00142FF4BC|nr:Gfo/Idh/MocA family oxidoreductase [Pseudooceanicola sp. HF7]NIZ08170.1 Gfo/Idh/MocA family oxidoreductase [Pseudooceanicola sp. HF7]
MDIALVGIGKIALDQHVPSLESSADWELAATVSRHGTVDGVPAYDDFDKMLEENPGIRVVSLCLPPVPRFDYAAKALKAGRHVMLEKPPGATMAECAALEALAREKGVSLFATWHSREADKVDAARDWLADKTLKSLTVTWKEDVRRWHPGQDWIFAPGGLGVFDPGINALSIVTKILPDAVHLTDAVLSVPENRQAPIAAELSFYHPGGAEVSCTFDFRQEGEQIWTIEAVCEEGTLLLTHGGGQMYLDGVAQGETETGLAGEYPRLYAAMAKLVRTGGIDMDLSPMRHVADAFLLGRRDLVEPFEF